ncbi:hypothetical protein JZ751_009659 [Albula glossodonta]|uniref:protein-glutamine gamma-glutamyltransferase n=1 Tax=Albula glossodonta TaxID=121402 RepID=A0A8T2P062_9TELE|nr:hypothetical protein JZ751_009659 [Albula glossodonta]
MYKLNPYPAALKINNLDFLREKNGKLHHTSDFLTKALTVRRGQDFKIRLRFSRELLPQDRVVIQLSLGHRPLQAKETLVLLPLQRDPEPGRWSATITHTSQNEVTSPLTANDDVYLPDEDALSEYVLNDMGYIYVGHSSDIAARPWNFGQFEEGVLEVCMELLDQKGQKQAVRRDPVRLARAMSSLVNSNDDRGVVIGNWSGKYPQGTSPLEWTGSSAILLQYGKTHSPVKYGQCWVFSGVLTTGGVSFLLSDHSDLFSVMRCLGIPTRSVTNFSSAHDTEGNLTIDVYVNKQGEWLDDMTFDSIWNFHVWNDVWMKRTDLPEGYEGWQALDSTPQEESEGMYQCGPCPLKAIKNGEVHLPHDTSFLFSEVNANRVVWRVDNPDSDRQAVTKVREQRHTVGQNISTKAVGQDAREDITLQYKYPEAQIVFPRVAEVQCVFRWHAGSPEEKRVAEKAFAIQSAAGPSQETRQLDVNLQCFGPTRLGSPVSVPICLTNLASHPLTLNVTVAAQLQSYIGKTVATVKAAKQEVTIQAGESTDIPMELTPAEYLPKLSQVNDEVLLRITVIAECAKPYFMCMGETITSFDLLLELGTLGFDPGSLLVKKPSPLPMMPQKWGHLNKGKATSGTGHTERKPNTTGLPMDNCKLLIEGLGLFQLTTFNEGNIPVGRIFRSEILCTPYRTGKRKIIARIISDHISGITAEGTVTVV